MAQTKTKTRSKSSSSSKASKASSRSSSAKRGSSSSRSQAKSNGAKRSGAKSSKPQRSQPKSSSNGSGPAGAALHAVEDKAKGAGRAVGGAAKKAKVPLMAGGAALAGAAGGLALGMHRRPLKRLALGKPRRPQIKVRSQDIAKAAKEVGNFSSQVGKLASELQQAREENGKHRSPVEVVLDGLTARH